MRSTLIPAALAVAIAAAASAPAAALMPPSASTAAASASAATPVQYYYGHRYHHRRGGWVPYPLRGFEDPGYAYHGNINGCAEDLGYGRWESCDRGR
jgi:opacity protein-like surface antigen